MDAAAREWTLQKVAEHGLREPGAPEPVKLRPWASVFRLSTSGGDVYFKANAPGGRHEPALAARLASEWPDLVPGPLAIDAARGWMLTRDHGRRMGDVLDPTAQRETLASLLPRYAALQLASMQDPDCWLALGVPDRRTRHLPALAEQLIRSNPDLTRPERVGLLALLPKLASACAELAAVGPLGDAVEHGDLHGANILVGAAGPWIFDWADASVTHPFCTLLVTCNTVVEDLESAEGRAACARLVDAYLEPFGAIAPAASLRALFSVAAWVAHVSRALDWEQMLAGTTSPDLPEWSPQIARWLRAWEERVELGEPRSLALKPN